MPSPIRRLRGWLRDHSLVWRRPARRLLQAASILFYRWRTWRGSDEPPRVIARPGRGRHLPPREAQPPSDLGTASRPMVETMGWTIPSLRDGEPPPDLGTPQPGVRLGAPRDGTPRTLRDGAPRDGTPRAPRGGTPRVPSDGAIIEPGFWLAADGGLDDLPPTAAESLLLAAAAEDLAWCGAGWTAPAAGRIGPSGEIHGDSLVTLLRLPRRGAEDREVVGRLVGHVTDGAGLGDRPRSFPPWVRSGPYLLRPNGPKVVRHRVCDVCAALRELPPAPGPRTALFLLPFLAVGGAEKLLFDLLAGLRERYRLLVVTLEPHLAHLGQTVDACRALTPYVYTLGDWLPRAAHAGALRHLLRRYQVESLVCWNGVGEFYDQVAALRRESPDLRILNQLYNHEGGWIEHLGPASIAAIDVHLAVNRHIAAALERVHGVATGRIAVVHHGVEIPPAASDSERRERRRKSREKLGLPEGAVVAGTFVRLHPQKRPLDVLGLARRLADVRPELHFLLAGGGPLDHRIDRELERAPLPNLERLPLQRDVDALYDASDLCLSTSSFEGLPVFLLEALARGIPCVATAVGDVPDLLRDGGGILVERPGDLDALQAGIEALLDPERRRLEGLAGHRTVAERFGLGPYRDRYERLIFPEDDP